MLDSAEAMEAELRAIGAARYHDKHPFHQLLNAGKLNKAQVAAWALNRYYYQARIPIKDAVILARLDDPALRREWRQRIIDHDGDGPDDGGIERWLRLTDSLGLDREEVVSLRGLLPGTRFAVDAYAQFVGSRSVLEAVASSLTELFAPQLIATRVSGMLASYDFVSRETLAYFDKRLTQAPRDSNFALDYCKQHATTPARREQVCDALRFKCGLLWAQLDALHYAYVEPGHIPPGAWVPAP
ncbi:MAG: pyrroloquinoline-quinone synthase PqqC [Alphaproteobacteria bacterium]